MTVLIGLTRLAPSHLSEEGLVLKREYFLDIFSEKIFEDWN